MARGHRRAGAWHGDELSAALAGWQCELTDRIWLPAMTWQAFAASGLGEPAQTREPVRLTVEHRGRLIFGWWIIASATTDWVMPQGALSVTCQIVLLHGDGYPASYRP